MKEFKHIYFVISPADYEKIAGDKTITEFLPKTSPNSIILKNKGKLDIWVRADTPNDVIWFKEKFKTISYKYGEGRNNLEEKE